jgi:glycogen operon protein
VVIDPAFSWGVERAPATPWDRTVIYEAHVRGLTMQHPDVPQAERGTFSRCGTMRWSTTSAIWG